MAEPLKNAFGAEVPRGIAAAITAVHPAFPARAFVRDALDGYLALELMPRARHIAAALAHHLPADYARAAPILLDSLGPPLARTADNGMAPFFYLPHVLFVAAHGLDHFELSMRAQYELTQRFTAEFSIRHFLVRHPQRTLAQLAQWCDDASEHVRRLVSEGTRPRLPWAMRLPAFQRDPRPVLALLECLRDDPSAYVRRSVANNLNDIGKDNPRLLVATAARWLKNAPAPRAALVRHALRSAVKAGDRGALKVLGYGGTAAVALSNIRIAPRAVALGGRVAVGFDVVNTAARAQRLLVDLRVHYVKANGRTGPKVYKLKSVRLAPQARASFVKTLSLADRTTRRHHPGRHALEALVNGRALKLGAFALAAQRRRS